MLQYLTTTFIAGILALLPLLITVAVAWFVYSKLLVWFGPGSRFGRLPKMLAEKTAMHPVLAYFSIFAVVVLLILGIGALAKRSTEQRISNFVERIPILRSIYGGTEQVVSALQLTDRGVPNSFTQVLLVKLHNLRILGIQACGETIELDGRQYYSVYFPNTPIPATGQLYLVPVEDAAKVDISVEEMMQIYISMGSLSAETLAGVKLEYAALDPQQMSELPRLPDSAPGAADESQSATGSSAQSSP
ncbi:DUF502 domain-containing protein [bacterium]|nr:DUF502 domain-containing protein [bacterium]